VKPVLAEYKYWLNMSDEVVGVGNRVYVKATCSVLSEKGVIAVATGFAREAETKKGMDDSQITGAASSYARKYALNGLFAIDDTKDADSIIDGEMEAKGLPYCNEETMTSAITKYGDAIADGKITATQVVGNIKTKCILTEEQEAVFFDLEESGK